MGAYTSTPPRPREFTETYTGHNIVANVDFPHSTFTPHLMKPRNELVK